MILDEPWTIAADWHRSGKAMTVMNMFKTVIASHGAAPIFYTRMTIVVHSCVFVWPLAAEPIGQGGRAAACALFAPNGQAMMFAVPLFALVKF